MDPLTIYGLLAVGSMLFCYGLEHRSAAFVLAFAASCLASSLYGFLQGAWPFGLIEAVWAAVALRRWQLRRQTEAGRQTGAPDPGPRG